MEAPALSDGVIVVDAFTPADADAHLAGEDEEHARRFGWFPDRSTPETVRAAIERWTREWGRDGSTRALAARVDGILAGGCEVRVVAPAQAELSYWTFPSFRRRGIATRALRLAVEWAVREPGIRHLELHVAPDNLASRRVAEAAGFRLEGRVADELRYVLDVDSG